MRAVAVPFETPPVVRGGGAAGDIGHAALDRCDRHHLGGGAVEAGRAGRLLVQHPAQRDRTGVVGLETGVQQRAHAAAGAVGADEQRVTAGAAVGEDEVHAGVVLGERLDRQAVPEGGARLLRRADQDVGECRPVDRHGGGQVGVRAGRRGDRDRIAVGQVDAREDGVLVGGARLGGLFQHPQVGEGVDGAVGQADVRAVGAVVEIDHFGGDASLPERRGQRGAGDAGAHDQHG